MEYFYSSRIEEERIFLDEEESHHCIKVMRHRTGDELYVTDGRGKLFRARIITDGQKDCSLQILEIIKEELRPYPNIHIAIAPTKNIDRFEWFLEKATEIGMTEITPILCRRSERDKIKKERMEKIVVSAMKQSLCLWRPVLNTMVSLRSFLESNPGSTVKHSGDFMKFICHCQSQSLPSLSSLYRDKKEVLILIGPEGDFTLEEISLAESNGFSGVNLGSSRLRTETAGIVAVHTIHLLNETGLS